MTNGERLRAWREAQGVSQHDLADRLGVSQAMVSKWESGVHTPGLSMAVALEDVCGVPVRDWSTPTHAGEAGASDLAGQSGADEQVGQ